METVSHSELSDVASSSELLSCLWSTLPHWIVKVLQDHRESARRGESLTVCNLLPAMGKDDFVTCKPDRCCLFMVR